jgi:hypothetical protein
MSYGNTYGERVQTLEGAGWYKTVDLGRVLRSIGGINFSVVTQRAQALQTINEVVTDCPYGFETEFPERGTYVCDQLGDWPRKFTQVVEALSFKETTSNPGSETNQRRKVTPSGSVPGSIEQAAPNEWDYNMAERAFFTGVEQMRAQLGRNDRVFGKRSFHSEFGLEFS